jgi:hypothetical protein
MGWLQNKELDIEEPYMIDAQEKVRTMYTHEIKSACSTYKREGDYPPASI